MTAKELRQDLHKYGSKEIVVEVHEKNVPARISYDSEFFALVTNGTFRFNISYDSASISLTLGYPIKYL